MTLYFIFLIGQSYLTSNLLKPLISLGLKQYLQESRQILIFLSNCRLGKVGKFFNYYCLLNLLADFEKALFFRFLEVYRSSKIKFLRIIRIFSRIIHKLLRIIHQTFAHSSHNFSAQFAHFCA